MNQQLTESQVFDLAIKHASHDGMGICFDLSSDGSLRRFAKELILQANKKDSERYEEVIQFATDKEAKHIMDLINSDADSNRLQLCKIALQGIYNNNGKLYRKVDKE